MTASPDARLVALHAETGDPHARLSRALADLEGAEWGLLFSGEAALAQQFAALLGAGTLRVDPLLKVSREVFAAAGLALATIDADWRGAKAVWLLEPDERAFKRAQRAGVQIIADATLAPGGDWLRRGAAYLAYRDGATLSGFGDVQLSAVFGSGDAPSRAAPAPSDLSMAMVLRDLATLPLRLARAARTTTALAEHFGGAAQSAGPTALLLSPDSAADTYTPLGGVLAAAVNVSAGTLVTPGVQAPESVMALLRPETGEPVAADQRPTSPLPAEPTPNPAPTATPTQTAPPQAPEHHSPANPDSTGSTHYTAAPPAPRRQEPLNYTPEIVFSDSLTQSGSAGLDAAHTQSTPVSSGPDEADTALFGPDKESGAVASEQVREQYVPRPEHKPERQEIAPAVAEAQAGNQGASQAASQAATGPQPSAPQLPPRGPQRAAQPQPQPHEPEPESESEIILPPDLPLSAAKDPTEGLDDAQRAAFARLRDWRNAEAKKLELSRFIIASNATLAEIARSAPQNEAELRNVRGMGPERVRKYGEALLRVVNG